MKKQIFNLVQKFPKRKIEDYQKFVGSKKIREIKKLAKDLKDKKILIINATPSGGGVAELLKFSYMPIFLNLDLKVKWLTMVPENPKKGYLPNPSFFEFTKRLHNGLQGHKWSESKKSKNLYLKENQAIAEIVNSLQKTKAFDLVVNHDPQPVALIEYVKKTQPWIWRCHIDTTHPNPNAWDFIAPYVKKHDQLIFTMRLYAHRSLSKNKINLITPIIDPYHEKFTKITKKEAYKRLSDFGINPKRKIMTQVSRFDPWKDPFGVIKIYKMLKSKYPDLQLVYSGPLALDDPEAILILEKMKKEIKKSKEIKLGKDAFLLHNQLKPKPFSYIETAALWSVADLIYQISTREGFGMIVSEAMWMENPLIGTDVGGISPQIVHEKTGFKIQSKDYQKAIEYGKKLLDNKSLKRKLGKKAKEHVRKNYLVTEGILKYLKLFKKAL